MLIIPKKDFPKSLNPIGLKRGDIIEIEIGDATPDFITLDPATLKLNVMRNPGEPREPLVKISKPKAPAMMPLPDLKTMIQKPMPPMAPPAASAPAPMPPVK